MAGTAEMRVHQCVLDASHMALKMPFSRATSAAGASNSAILPLSSTHTRSASMIVLRRCAMVSTVEFCGMRMVAKERVARRQTMSDQEQTENREKEQKIKMKNSRDKP